MPRTKSKSSKLAGIIDAAQKLTNDLAAFSEELSDTMAEAAKYRELKPRLDQLSGILGTPPHVVPPGPDNPPGLDNPPGPPVNRQRHSKKKKDNGQIEKAMTNLDQDQQP